MKGKFMIIAALLGALTFGACVDSEESSSVTAVRNAKAEQLKSIATLNNAKAQAEATIAAAEAQLAAAQAQLLAAEAAALNAETEAQKIANQVAAAEAEQKIAEIEAAMELAAIKYQMDLAKAMLQFNMDSETLLAELYNEYAAALDAQYTAKKNVAKAQSDLAAAEKGLASVEETYNATIAKKEAEIAKKEAEIAEKNAELELVKKVSVYDMTWDDLVKCRDEAKKTLDAAILNAATEAKKFAAAQTAWTKYQNSLDSSAYMKAYDGTTSTYGFTELYSYDVNHILPTMIAAFQYDHDGNKNTAKVNFIGFKGGEWDLTTKTYVDYADTKGIALFSDDAANSSKYDFNGKKKGASGYKGDDYAHNPRVRQFNIVAENVAAYKAIANEKLGYYYDSRRAAAANAVELAKSAFEKATNGASNKTVMDNLVADYTKVTTEIAKYEASLESAQHAVANYQQFITEFGLTATSTIISATDYAAGAYSYPYATYTKFFNAAIAALKKEAEANHWLNGPLVSTVAAEKAFLNALKSGVISTTTNGTTTVTYVYENYGLYGIAQTIGANFDSTTGAYLGTDNGYFAAIDAQATLEEAYATDKYIVDYAVAILETMAAEAENWTALAIDGYNEANATFLAAKYANAQAAANVTATSTKIANITSFVNDLAGNNGVGLNDAQELERICAEKIAALKADIAKLEDEIKDLQDEIKALSLEKETATAEDAIVVAQKALAKAEADLAVAEANVAMAKAALDAALAE